MTGLLFRLCCIYVASIWALMALAMIAACIGFWYLLGLLGLHGLMWVVG